MLRTRALAAHTDALKDVDTDLGGSMFLRLPETPWEENTMKARKAPLLALTSALMAATSASSASAWENPLENPYLDEPLEVCDQGSFFVGGVPKVTKYAAGPTA